jgi:FkbM family methyltransferase
VNTLLRQVGLEVHRVGFGHDPVHDAQVFLSLGTNSVLFDVGANHGQSIKRFRRRFNGAKIHAFEPSPINFAKLQMSTQDDPLLRLNNFALGAKSAALEFQQNTHSDMSSFLSPGKEHWGGINNVTTVQVETLHNYCQRNSISKIDLLKIDTQGYDLEVLRGAKQMLSEHRIRSLLIEITLLIFIRKLLGSMS